MQNIDNNLLEQTEVYFYPQKTANDVTVNIGGALTTVIDSQQVFTINLYISQDAYESDIVRKQLISQTSIGLNSVLSKSTVSIDKIIAVLRAVYDSNTVITFNVKGLGGSDNNYDSVRLINSNEKLSLSKELYLQEDGTMIVKENISINFFEYK